MKRINNTIKSKKSSVLYNNPKILITLLILLSSCTINRNIQNIKSFNTKNYLLTKKGIYKKIIAWKKIITSDNTANNINDFIVTDNNFIISYKNKGITIIANNKTNNLTQKNSGLKSDLIKNIYYNKQSGLWITYQNYKGISLYKKGKWFFYNKDQIGIETDKISDADFDTYGNFWIISYKYGIFCYKIKYNKWSKYNTEKNPNLPSNNIFIIKPEKKGTGIKNNNIWFVSERGFFYYNIDKNTWHNYGKRKTAGTFFLNIIGIENKISKTPINLTGLEIKKRSVLISTSKKLYNFDGKKLTKINVPYLGGIDKKFIYNIKYFNKNIYLEIYSRTGSSIKFDAILYYSEIQKEWKYIDLYNYINNIKNIKLLPTVNACYILASSKNKEALLLLDHRNNSITRNIIK